MSRPEDKIKVPARSHVSKVEKALTKAPRDGNWVILVPDMGMTSAEQTARAYNVPGGQWEFGYTIDIQKDLGDLVSNLWVRWVG